MNMQKDTALAHAVDLAREGKLGPFTSNSKLNAEKIVEAAEVFAKFLKQDS